MNDEKGIFCYTEPFTAEHLEGFYHWHGDILDFNTTDRFVLRKAFNQWLAMFGYMY